MWHDLMLYAVGISLLSTLYVVVVTGNKKPELGIRHPAQATRITPTNITK